MFLRHYFSELALQSTSHPPFRPMICATRPVARAKPRPRSSNSTNVLRPRRRPVRASSRGPPLIPLFRKASETMYTGALSRRSPSGAGKSGLFERGGLSLAPPPSSSPLTAPPNSRPSSSPAPARPSAAKARSPSDGRTSAETMPAVATSPRSPGHPSATTGSPRWTNAASPSGRGGGGLQGRSASPAAGPSKANRPPKSPPRYPVSSRPAAWASSWAGEELGGSSRSSATSLSNSPPPNSPPPLPSKRATKTAVVREPSGRSTSAMTCLSPLVWPP
mmetsp:Transcript_25467/g.57175  ORF Transcript_25467/g.57175 Transcript_25467/m.57175 type:complete len:277 (+) Transcript_25467:242-1072(+)